jgi:uncharacterized protein (TIGR03435 family)
VHPITGVRGFDLKTLIAQVYGVDVSRVEFPDVDAGKKRYDVAAVLPKEENEEAIKHLVQEAFQKQFNLTITPENRVMDVYVVSAPNGPAPELRQSHALGGSAGSNSIIEWNSPDGRQPTMEDVEKAMNQKRASSGISVNGIDVFSGTIQQLCRVLEEGLDRLVVDETNLTGSYDYQVSNFQNRQELFRLLRNRFGLVVTLSQRNVTMLVVRSVGPANPAR